MKEKGFLFLVGLAIAVVLIGCSIGWIQGALNSSIAKGKTATCGDIVGDMYDIQISKASYDSGAIIVDLLTIYRPAEEPKNDTEVEAAINVFLRLNAYLENSNGMQYEPKTVNSRKNEWCSGNYVFTEMTFLADDKNEYVLKIKSDKEKEKIFSLK